MRTLIWKELRENGKWAALAFLCLLLAEFYALAGTRNSNNYDQYRQITLCSPSFLMVSAFGCAAAALALAIVQILPERKRDQWAALLHRPVPRSTIFLGKAAAGMLLYGAAAIPAFAASAIYAALPGRFAAPFVPQLLLPGLSDLLMGPAFYFGAMLLCLHPGRWFGSCGAIALSLAAVLIIHLAGQFFFGLPVAAGLLYFGASWGALLSNGPGLHQPWAAWLARLIVLFAGGEAALLLVMVVWQLLPGRPVSFALGAEFSITPEGTVLLARRDAEGGVVITDLQGNPSKDTVSAGNRATRTMVEPQFFAMHKTVDIAVDESRSSWPIVRPEEIYGSKEIWYLLVKQRYFVGYDKLSRRKIGICDVDGFKPAAAPVHPFPRKLRESIFDSKVCWCGNEVYRFDFSEHEMVGVTMPDERIYGATTLRGNQAADTPPQLAVALENVVRIHRPDGTLQTEIPYPHDWHVWPYLSLAENVAGDRLYLQSSAWWYFDNDPVLDPTTFLDVYDAQGKSVASYQYVNPPPVVKPESAEEHALALTAPFLPVVAGTIYERWKHRVEGDSSTYFGGVSFPHPQTRAELPDLALLAVLTVILSLATWIGARRAGFASRPARGWALLVLALGVPGLLTFCLAADWPVRVRCPHCGGRRRIDSLVCEQCHAPWLPPVNTGAEIVEEALR